MDFINELKKRLEEKLPAETAHASLMSYKRKSPEEILREKEDVKESAVLCLLFQEDGDWKIYLMERNSYDGVHSGQISFPGGRVEEADENYTETALREANEELNILADEVEVLGALSPLYIPPSNFLVYPFVAVSKSPQDIQPDPREVKKVLKADLKSLLAKDAVSESMVSMSGADMKIKVKHYTVDDHVVWGATGMILSEMILLIKEVGFQN